MPTPLVSIPLAKLIAGRGTFKYKSWINVTARKNGGIDMVVSAPMQGSYRLNMQQIHWLLAFNKLIGEAYNRKPITFNYQRIKRTKIHEAYEELLLLMHKTGKITEFKLKRMSFGKLPKREEQKDGEVHEVPERSQHTDDKSHTRDEL